MKQWIKHKDKFSFCDVEQAEQVQFAPFSVKSTILELVVAFSNLAGQRKFYWFWPYLFTRTKQTVCVYSKHAALWKLESLKIPLKIIISANLSWKISSLCSTLDSRIRVIKADDWKIEVLSRMPLCGKTTALLQ